MAKLRKDFWAELIFTEEKIRSLCEEWLNYLGTLYFAADPLKGPQSPPSLSWPGDTQKLICDFHIVIVLILSAPNLPFQEESLLPCPPGPHSRLLPGCRPMLVFLPHLRAALPAVWCSTFSIWHTPSHSQAHSLSHCPQYPSAICNSIFQAPIAFCRDFCQRAYQSVIIACLHVSLWLYMRPLKTDCAFLVHLWIPVLSTLRGAP